MSTPADELRTAAEKLRRDADAARKASPPPWVVTNEHVVRCADNMIVADRSDTDHPAERADLPYIAAMHPGVGTALAELLERQGRVAAEVQQFLGDEFQEGALDQDVHDALAVARAINGTAT